MSPELNEEQKAEALAELIELYGEDIVKDVVDEAEKKIAIEEAEQMLEEAVFDLDAALDSYDPTFPIYTPSKDALEFFILMRLVQGGDFEFDTPIAHYFIVDLLLGGITDVMQFPYSEAVCKTIDLDPLRVGIMASRGLAKSTVGISFFGVYSAIKGEIPNGIGKVYFYLLIAASSKGGARVNALAVRAMCEDSVWLKDYFEEMRFTETESEFTRKDPTGKIPTKDRSFLIRYQGYSTGIRGSRYGERRPDLIGFDDAILNTAAAYSKVMSENLDEIIHSDSINALKGGGKGRVVLYFTPFHYGDVNTKALIQGAFTQCVIPLAKDFNPEQPGLKATDIKSSWESMHPAKSIAALVRGAIKSKKLRMFLQERMLRLTSEANRLVSDKSLDNWYNIKDVMANIANYTVLITTDYTTSSGEKKDFSGRATWAISSNDDWFLLDLSLRKMGIQEQYRDTLQSASKYKRLGKYVEIGIEVDGNQLAHIDGISQMMRRQGTYYSFARQRNAPESRIGILSRGSGVQKHERFRIVAPRFTQKKIFFPEHLKNTPDMKELLLQIKGATHSTFTRADDGPDLFSMLEQIDYMLPVDSVFTKNSYTDDEGYVWEREEVSAYDSY